MAIWSARLRIVCSFQPATPLHDRTYVVPHVWFSQRYFIFFLFFVFSLAERKNRVPSGRRDEIEKYHIMENWRRPLRGGFAVLYAEVRAQASVCPHRYDPRRSAPIVSARTACPNCDMRAHRA